MERRNLYFDYVASTPVVAAVLEQMLPYYADKYGNPSSLHRHGIALRDAIKKAREQILSFLGSGSEGEVIFTSSGTEAANLAVQGIARAAKGKGRHIIAGSGEHPAVWRSIESLAKEGFEISWVSLDSEGVVDPEEIRQLIRKDTVLVAIQHGNHEVGSIQPISRISAITREKGIPLYCDASASAGWIPVNVEELGADLVSLSPHHFYGPKGVGVLWEKRGITLAPLLWGGRQEGGLRPGTENIPAIVGAGFAAELALQGSKRAEHCRELQRLLFGKLHSMVPYARLTGPCPGAKRLPHHVSICVECVEGEALMLRLDLQGIAVTSVTGCATVDSKIPRTLRSIGLTDQLALSSIIIGLSEANSADDVDYFLEKLRSAVDFLRKMSPKWKAAERGEISLTLLENGD